MLWLNWGARSSWTQEHMFQFKGSLKSTLRQYKSESYTMLSLELCETPREPLGIWQPEPLSGLTGCPEMCALTWTMRLAPIAKEASIQDTVQNLPEEVLIMSFKAIQQ